MRSFAKTAAVAMSAVLVGLFGSRRAGSAPSPGGPAPSWTTAVVVELFSSEGCSSCPPADAWVAELARSSPIRGVTVIALEEDVDYWDRLGWRDPFGDPAFSARQQRYARALADHGVFTPEVILDGRAVLPTGDLEEARSRITRAVREPRARVSLRREGGSVVVDVLAVPASGADDPAEVWLAVTESGLVSRVTAGENAGRQLAHAPIVRQLRALGRVGEDATFHQATKLELDPTWRPEAVRIVVFVQRASSRAIVGAAQL